MSWKQRGFIYCDYTIDIINISILSTYFLWLIPNISRCPEFANPCSTGDPALAPLGGILFCAANAQTCPATYWCHIGDVADNTVRSGFIHRLCLRHGSELLIDRQFWIFNKSYGRIETNSNLRCAVPALKTHAPSQCCLVLEVRSWTDGTSIRRPGENRRSLDRVKADNS